MSVDPILVWRFKEAPEEYQKLSDHGGDEDWVAFLPDSYEESFGTVPQWMEYGSFGSDVDPTLHKVKGGRVVIGAHA